ncbi:MAG: hypothetical protein ACP5I7_07155, partial [Sulfolobales archaeon]
MKPKIMAKDTKKIGNFKELIIKYSYKDTIATDQKKIERAMYIVIMSISDKNLSKSFARDLYLSGLKIESIAIKVPAKIGVN